MSGTPDRPDKHSRVRTFINKRKTKSVSSAAPETEQPGRATTTTAARFSTAPAPAAQRQRDNDTHTLLDPSAISAVADLDLIARWVVEGFMHGLHTSPYVGFSVEFASHREYLPGDDLRHLNWKLYGRHDRLYVKQYDAETNLELHIVMDVSGSMAGVEPIISRTGGTRSSTQSGGSPTAVSKFRYASILAAAMAHLAMQQRDAVGLTLFADRVIDNIRPGISPDHLMDVLQTISRVSHHPRVDSPAVLHEVAELMPRRGLVCVISDCYYNTDELFAALNHFRHYGHDVVLFHVMSPVEYHLNVDGAVRFRDRETGETIVTQAHEIRTDYHRAVTEWVDEIHRGCLSRDIDHSLLVTDTPLDQGLMDYFVKRSQLY